MNERNPQSTHFGLSEQQWQQALAREVDWLRVVRGFAVHGRCCPECGTFLVDFGD